MVRSSLRRSTLFLSAIALLASLVATPASAAPPAGKGAPSNTAVFFASDGLRQDIVAKYAAQGLLPTMSARSSRTGRRRPDNGLLTQAPPNTGAGWYSLATGAWPGVHGSTNNTFHINGQPFAQPDRGLRRGRPPGRVDRPVRRARRAQGRPGRVGRRAQCDDRRPDDRLPALLLGPRRRDQLHRQRRRRPVRRRGVHRRLRAPVRPPGRLRGPGAVPGRRPDRRRRAGRTSRRPTARPRRCASASSTSASTSTA